MARLARQDHLLVKLSGLTTMAELGAGPTADLAPYVDHLLECFGPQRLVFGSDWPVSRRAASYARTIATARELVARLPPGRARGGPVGQRTPRLPPPRSGRPVSPPRTAVVRRAPNEPHTQSGLTAALVLVVVCVGLVSSLGAPLHPGHRPVPRSLTGQRPVVR